MVTLGQDGRFTAVVETTFKQADDLKPAEQEEIQRLLDLYDLGRDPWLRGYERAGATGVTHECTGEPGAPRGITRKGVLPTLEAIVQLMPDPIANFRLLHDAGNGTETLRITHIDLSESLRDNRRRIEREVRELARLGYRFSEAHCDLYDYLAVHGQRRHDLLQALEDEKRIEGVLTPEETVLIRRLSETFEDVMAFGQQTTPPIMAALSFAPFDHAFCLRLPPETVMIDPGGFVPSGNKEEPSTWCAPRLMLEDLIDDLFPRADPPLLDETLREDAERLATAPFTCVRHTDEKALAVAIQARILPASRYEITWKTGEPAPR